MKTGNAETRASGPRLIGERAHIEEAKLETLQQAAHQGWADVSAGRYADVRDRLLDDFIEQLGLRAARRATPAS